MTLYAPPGRLVSIRRGVYTRRNGQTNVLSPDDPDVVCFRGNAQIYSGTAEHVARPALHKSAVRGVQELRKVSRMWRIIQVL